MAYMYSRNAIGQVVVFYLIETASFQDSLKFFLVRKFAYRLYKVFIGVTVFGQ